MDFSSIPLFAAIKRRVSWVTQRQEVLAHNIANADTPQFRPSDLKPFSFKEILRREPMQVNMDVTRSDHLGGRRRRLRDFAETDTRKPFETSPAGNAVILEEQITKISESQVKHQLAVELYKKHAAIFRLAISKGR